ncbi:MAG TPA: MlaD family protein [Caulobacteraceae bacterium]|jgi:phospholipid/cholesterol/gamma-HCH transport system substrate-binding protein|nr:MlaD family protein [Caulobacteraceae bacterium]
MERNAHYALVGLVSLLLLTGLVLFVIWLARVQFVKQYDLYDIDFKGPVRGLSAGGEVYFNGIRVGEVTKLSLDRNHPDRVVARVRISSDAPVRVDSTASLEPLGITGVNYVQITSGTSTRPLLKDVTPPNRVPVIRTVRGSLESILEGGGTVLARAVDALDRVNKLLSDKNIATISATFEDVHAITGEFRNQGELIAHLDETITNANVAVKKVSELTDSANTLVNGDARRTLANLGDAAEQMKSAAIEGRALVAGLKGPATDFTANGLPQITSTVIQLQTTVETLNRVIGDIEQNPRQLISKPAAKTLEVQP